MRVLLWVMLASFVVYNAIMLISGVRSPLFLSIESYMYGLLFFTGPFVALLIASAVGLARSVTVVCAGLGALVLAIVVWLIAINQAFLVAPAFLILFGVFSTAPAGSGLAWQHPVLLEPGLASDAARPSGGGRIGFGVAMQDLTPFSPNGPALFRAHWTQPSGTTD